MLISLRPKGSGLQLNLSGTFLPLDPRIRSLSVEYSGIPLHFEENIDIPSRNTLTENLPDTILPIPSEISKIRQTHLLTWIRPANTQSARVAREEDVEYVECRMRRSL